MNTLATGLEPYLYELKALALFRSTDTTRPHMATLWRYGVSVAGYTYVATDGHTMLVRRSGSHIERLPTDISQETPTSLVIPIHEAHVKPPHWASVLCPPSVTGPCLNYRGINPFYVARVGTVEKVAAKRAAEDWTPPRGYSKKQAARAKQDLVQTCFAVWTIGTSEMDPWYFRVNTPQALWEGVIMPRRLIMPRRR